MQSFRWVMLGVVLAGAVGCGAKPAPAPAPPAPKQIPTTKVPNQPEPTGEDSSDEGSWWAQNALTAEEISAGWIKLFDGETFFGWKPADGSQWSVADGVLVAESGEPGFLNTTTRFADYVLRCDCRIELGGNSGIFLRTPEKPANPAEDCYEFNICDTHPQFKTGSLVARAQPSKETQGDGVWRTYEMTIQGGKITAKIDGEPVLDYTDTLKQPRIGHVSLQYREGKVEFCNIYLKPLGTEPIFNGKDLAGWRNVPGGKSKFEVVDAAIHVTNGRGYLETEAVWDNFIFQAEILSNGKHLNSGIFFRAMPGTAEAPANGYESQVRNEWDGDDRNTAIDFGTGGIYRRVPARRVVSTDFEWFTKTLVAQGNHFAVWINGHQVTDWNDDREPNENPRSGLRTAAGHFSIQGHDPTTDLSFRKLRVARLPVEASGGSE